MLLVVLRFPGSKNIVQRLRVARVKNFRKKQEKKQKKTEVHLGNFPGHLRFLWPFPHVALKQEGSPMSVQGTGEQLGHLGMSWFLFFPLVRHFILSLCKHAHCSALGMMTNRAEWD